MHKINGFKVNHLFYFLRLKHFEFITSFPSKTVAHRVLKGWSELTWVDSPALKVAVDVSSRGKMSGIQVIKTRRLQFLWLLVPGKYCSYYRCLLSWSGKLLWVWELAPGGAERRVIERLPKWHLPEVSSSRGLGPVIIQSLSSEKKTPCAHL